MLLAGGLSWGRFLMKPSISTLKWHWRWSCRFPVLYPAPVAAADPAQYRCGPVLRRGRPCGRPGSGRPRTRAADNPLDCQQAWRSDSAGLHPRSRPSAGRAQISPGPQRPPTPRRYGCWTVVPMKNDPKCCRCRCRCRCRLRLSTIHLSFARLLLSSGCCDL